MLTEKTHHRIERIQTLRRVNRAAQRFEDLCREAGIEPEDTDLTAMRARQELRRERITAAIAIVAEETQGENLLLHFAKIV